MIGLYNKSLMIFYSEWFETIFIGVQNCLLGCMPCKIIVDRRFRGTCCLTHP
jgi:hypothetical protein